MTAIKAIAFDMYGTLFDVHSVVEKCDEFFPGHGPEISTVWRQKSLEYSWLRSLMGSYASFEEITEDALEYTCNVLMLRLEEGVRIALCDAYLKLMPVPGTEEALTELKAMGLTLAILSNGTANSIRRLVSHSHLEQHFSHLLSVDVLKIYKPHHLVYELGEMELGLKRSEILFVSSNAWDISGARHFGYPVCWVNRTGNVFEKLGQTADKVIGKIGELPAYVRERNVN